jgi:hypothetical protein
MEHKLIMENWRKFVGGSDDIDPELLEEGFKETVAALLFGIGLATASPAEAGGSIRYPHAHSQARAVPAQGEAGTVGLNNIKQLISNVYNKMIEAEEDEARKAIIAKGLQAMVGRIDKIAASEEVEDLGSLSMWETAEDRDLAWEAFDQLFKQLPPPQAQALKKELTSAQKWRKANAAKTKDHMEKPNPILDDFYAKMAVEKGWRQPRGENN